MAYEKFAHQSSLYQVGMADRAVDGNLDGSFLNCTHTSSELGAWWVVDLQAKYLVQEVLITFSGGTKLSRNNNASKITRHYFIPLENYLNDVPFFQIKKGQILQFQLEEYLMRIALIKIVFIIVLLIHLMQVKQKL